MMTTTTEIIKQFVNRDFPDHINLEALTHLFAGYMARIKNEDFTNPHPEGSARGCSWVEGYELASRDLASNSNMITAFTIYQQIKKQNLIQITAFRIAAKNLLEGKFAEAATRMQQDLDKVTENKELFRTFVREFAKY